MPRNRRRLIADQNRLLVRIYNEALHLAPGRTHDDDVEDAVHDVVADCQAKLRSGRWMKTPKNLPAFVSKLVNDKIADHGRRRRRTNASAREFLRTNGRGYHDRQPAELSWTEDDIAAFLDEIAERLPYRCRKAYYMVRVEGATYKEAAARLRLSSHTVRNYIVQANRLFREELERVGFDVRTDHAVTCPDDGDRRPDDAAAVPTDDARQPNHPEGRPTDDASRTIRVDARPADDMPRTIDDAVRPDRVAPRPKDSPAIPTNQAALTDRDARWTNHAASRPNHEDTRTNDDAPWTQGNARRTDRNSWRTEDAAALRVRETLSQEN